MKHNSLRGLCGLLATAATAGFLLIGCNGSSGSQGAAGVNGINGTNGVNGTNGTSTVSTVNIAQLSNDEWSKLVINGSVTGVTVSATSGAPVVNFNLTDGNGTPLVGIGTYKSQSATQQFPTFVNVQFSIAKLVPGTAGSPSRWYNYIVTTIPAKPTGTATFNSDQTTWGLTLPGTDAQGTLVDNLDGSYTYTFQRDITKTVAAWNNATDSGANHKADISGVDATGAAAPANITFDASAIHRLTVQVGGAARNTGTTAAHNANTATGADSGYAAVLVKAGANLIKDFIPNGTAIDTTAQREIVTLAACNDCHSQLGATFHSGLRFDPRYCAICHTDQRKYGKTEAVYTDAVTTVNGVSTTIRTYTGDTSRINGQGAGYIPAFIHKMHMGESLINQGYNYGGIAFNGVTYPMAKNACTQCHSGSGARATTQGDNWFNNPSRVACTACHDGLNQHYSIVAGTVPDDSTCKGCHTKDVIQVDHYLNDVTPHNPVTPAGLSNFTYDLGTPSVNASHQLVVPFRISLNGTPVTSFNFPTNASVSSSFQIINGFTGGPSFYQVAAVPQDNVAAPADWNNRYSASLFSLMLPGENGACAGYLLLPDANGYWTAVITGTRATPITVPTGAKLVNAAIIGSFTQTGLDINTFGATTMLRPTLLKIAPINAANARRSVVSSANCNACHDQLGNSQPENVAAFHSGERNTAESCEICHNPNRSSGGWSASASSFIHAIHASEQRTMPFNWHGTATVNYGTTVTYPGVLATCTQCHVAGSYDFSSVANSAALPNLLPITVATGTFALNAVVPGYLKGDGTAYVKADGTTSYGSGYNSSTAVAPASGLTATLVNSPITAACSACHDSNADIAHFNEHGGSFYEARLTALTKTESCMICHGSGKIADVKTVHGN